MTKICAFCKSTIEEKDSICDDCKSKYKIFQVDQSLDGCGCDN